MSAFQNAAERGERYFEVEYRYIQPDQSGHWLDTFRRLPPSSCNLNALRLLRSSPSLNPPRWVVPTLIGSAAALGAPALYTAAKTRKAEQETPPIGEFLTVDGVRLHYIERGRGEPLVLIHGNGMMIQDFLVSGIVDDLAKRYRVIIDRPGYGYSDRPRGVWTPRAHATLYQKALQQLGVTRAVVLGHSWGALVAVALALQAPQLVRSLVLASGYYYPTLRADVMLSSPAAIPGIGDLMRHTVSPVVGRILQPAMIKAKFAPAAVPERFDRQFPKAMMLRPTQLRASAEDAALMTPVTVELEKHYRDLKLPVVIIVGCDDQIADVDRQSKRLHSELPDSELVVVPGMGHMIQHLAPREVIAAIDRAAEPVSNGVELWVWRTLDAVGLTWRRSAVLLAGRAWPDRTSVASRA